MLKVVLFVALVGITLAYNNDTVVDVSADSCIHCICLHESGCKPIGCHEDVGSLSCGYFQIKWPYYEDCGKPGGPTEADWKTCADNYECAVKCVNAYIARYARDCPGKGECQRMSRLHNGGPNGCNVAGTEGYWDVIHSCCGCS